MKAESDTMPTHPFVIDNRGELADITFFEGVKESEREDRTVFEYDSHTLTVPYRDDLEETVAEGYEIWLLSAKQAEIPAPKEPTDAERINLLENTMLLMMME